MSIDAKVLGEQFDRLRALNYFPSDEAAQKELRNAMKSAPNEIILTVAVNEWIEKETERPTPADLYRVIREQIEKSWVEELRPDPRCQLCKGEGFPHIERNGVSYSGPRCSCWARRPADLGIQA